MAIEKVEIKTKARKRFGQVYPAQVTGTFAEVERNKSIRIYGKYSNRDFDKTFKMGESAEYDSFNLTYYGEIVGISNKTVQIKESHGGRIHRLDLYTFMWRNHNFDVDAAFEHNANERMYI